MRVRPGDAVQDHVLAPTTDVGAVEGATGTLVLAGDELRLGDRLLPRDPALPGLVPVVDPGAVASLLTSCGAPTRPQEMTLRIRAYRPQRRAVIEAGAHGTSLFMEVVEPDEARPPHDRHRDLAAAGVPVPPSLGADPRGDPPGSPGRSRRGTTSPC